MSLEDMIFHQTNNNHFYILKITTQMNLTIVVYNIPRHVKALRNVESRFIERLERMMDKMFEMMTQIMMKLCKET